MFDLKGIRSINIDYNGLTALLTRASNNPLAEAEIPAMLIEAIASNIPVHVSDSAVGVTYRLYHENDSFKFVQEHLAAK